jgi:geranylgeranyl diphosphate synthase type II
MKFDQMSAQYRDYIQKFLSDWYARFHDEPQKQLFDAMEYSLLAGGKRLRPIFAFDFCRMCGKSWESAAPFAAAIEMIHTYSLIHDDLPCMDNDDFRRGNPTNHKVYGEAMAILAGDALLTAAFCQLCRAPYDAQTRIRAVEIIAQCAGELGMVGGQVLDIQSEERICTEQEVLDIQSRKTGALIRAACALGVLAGGGTSKQFDAAISFASNLGLAFQIRDDMLDVIGNAKELGKAVGVDTTKNTFVRLYGLDRCDELVQELTQKAIQDLKYFENNDYMIALSKSLTNRTI